jgi:hypothetical protein
MGDCGYILGMLFGMGVFLIFSKPIIKVLERIVGISPLEDPFKKGKK